MNDDSLYYIRRTFQLSQNLKRLTISLNMRKGNMTWDDVVKANNWLLGIRKSCLHNSKFIPTEMPHII